MQVGKPAHYRWLFGFVCAVLVLNLIDAVFTVMWYTSGAATEANPFMAVLLAWGPLPFVLGKILIVSAGSWLLWRRRRRPLAVICIFFAFMVYYFILLYHLGALQLRVLSAPDTISALPAQRQAAREDNDLPASLRSVQVERSLSRCLGSARVSVLVGPADSANAAPFAAGRPRPARAESRLV